MPYFRRGSRAGARHCQESSLRGEASAFSACCRSAEKRSPRTRSARRIGKVTATIWSCGCLRLSHRVAAVDGRRRYVEAVRLALVRVRIVAAWTMPQGTIWPKPFRLLRLPRFKPNLPRRVAHTPIDHVFVPRHRIVFPCGWMYNVEADFDEPNMLLHSRKPLTTY